MLNNEIFGLCVCVFVSETSKLKFKWENVRANVDNTLKHMPFYKIIFSVVKVM